MSSPVGKIKSEKKLLLKKYLDETIKNSGKLFTHNPDPTFVLDLEGQIVAVNPAFEKLSQYCADDFINMKLQYFFPLDSLDKLFNHFHKSTLGQVQNFDCAMYIKSGKICDLNITNIPLSVEDQVIGVYAVAKDVTQVKKNNEVVRKIEEVQMSLTDYVLDIIVCTNLLGNILYISPSCEQILGFTPDELMNQNLISMVHSDDVEKTVLVRQEVVVDLIHGRTSYQLGKKDGSYIWVEALCRAVVDPETRNIIEVVSVIRDITERKRAEEELWSRKKAFRSLIENSPDAVIIAWHEEILFINVTGVNLVGGNSSEEILSKSIMDFVHPDYHNIVRERMKSVYDGGITDFLEYKMLQMDGTILEAEIKAIPTFFQNKPCHHIIIRDISERKKTHELLLNSEKISIAGQLAAGIAHEVRNPLTAIKGFLQLMEAQLDNKTYFHIIQGEMDRIELILSELLVLAKPQEAKFGIEKVNTLIDDVKALLDTQAIMNDIQIEIINEMGDLKIKCDKNQLKQVFINFIKNALEAMPNGGNIIIEVKKYSEEKARILIKDTGTGIPQPILKRIGQPFFTTKEGGTGLGVMISKQIIENHNGSVHFWSDERGTMIEIILPFNLE
jgi:two-component system, sporulation sensor kinase A